MAFGVNSLCVPELWLLICGSKINVEVAIVFLPQYKEHIPNPYCEERGGNEDWLSLKASEVQSGLRRTFAHAIIYFFYFQFHVVYSLYIWHILFSVWLQEVWIVYCINFALSTCSLAQPSHSLASVSIYFSSFSLISAPLLIVIVSYFDFLFISFSSSSLSFINTQ